MVAEGDFQDHGSEGVQTMVSDHGFARVGTMQVQAIMPRLIRLGLSGLKNANAKRRIFLNAKDLNASPGPEREPLKCKK